MPLILFIWLLLPAIAAAQNTPSFSVRSLMQQRTTVREQADQFLQQGKGAQAIPMYESWLRLAPTDAEAALNLASAYASVGRGQDALASLQLALQNGLRKTSRITADTRLAPLLRSTDPAAVDVRSRLAADTTSVLMYTPQTRIGTSLVTYPEGYTPDQQYRLVVLLHGNGHSSAVMTSWAKRLGLRDVIFVAPQAPYVKMLETIASLRERYSAAGEELNAPDSLLDDVVTTSAEWYHDAMMQAWRTLPVSQQKKPIVIGFSQGGFYAHVLATRYPGDIEAFCSISASMYAHGNVTPRYPQLRTFGVRALVLHGTKDEVVPLQTAELIHAGLQQAGVDHNYFTFDGAHWPTSEADRRIVEWLKTL
ncbi:MAG: tetratricopeptide repeat protein [Candidatus Kapabacteria bacterium]|nr:tetratricopeptide repeat protein [Candidatus Kapabacteria bacterium]